MAIRCSSLKYSYKVGGIFCYCRTFIINVSVPLLVLASAYLLSSTTSVRDSYSLASVSDMVSCSSFNSCSRDS